MAAGQQGSGPITGGVSEAQCPEMNILKNYTFGHNIAECVCHSPLHILIFIIIGHCQQCMDGARGRY